VRGGKRLRTKERPVGESIIAKTWINMIEQPADEETRVQGFEYAIAGQVAAFNILAGSVDAKVQGRKRRPYIVRILFPVLADVDWENLIEKLAAEAGTVAALLDNLVPDSVLKTLNEINLPLIPEQPTDFRFHCSCRDDDDDNENNPNTSPCKHAVALAYVFAEHLDAQPMSAFAMRGMKPQTLLERLRMQRIMDSAGGTAQAVQEVDLSDLTSATGTDENHVDQNPSIFSPGITFDAFWSAGPDLDAVTDDLITAENPPHALLRRLGQSPFAAESKFPMVGLLATCYDIISDSAKKELIGPDDDDNLVSRTDTPIGDDDGDSNH